jgi:two-component system CheB/CheR fusion protein
VPAPRIPVCAVGASAGGLEALQQLFRDLPPDLGLAYIVATHTSPDGKSELPAMLARWTTMPVVQVADHGQQTLAPDHVYVMAPDRTLQLSASTVAASPFMPPRGHNPGIDLFFRSVAAEHSSSCRTRTRPRTATCRGRG